MKSRAAQLEKQIKILIDDSVVLLKARMTELDINATSPVDLLAKAKEIVMRHKDLQAKAARLQTQVRFLPVLCAIPTPILSLILCQFNQWPDISSCFCFLKEGSYLVLKEKELET